MKSGTALIAEINATPVEAGDAVFWWLGQLGYVVKTATAIIYFDPYLTPRPDRLVAPLLHPEEVSNANLVLGTHNHSDHIDRPAWPRIAAVSPNARFIVPRAVAAQAAQMNLDPTRVIGLDAEAEWQASGTQVTAIAAAHEFFDRDEVTGYPYLGYLVRSGGVTIYHSGDTLRYEGLETRLRQQPLDLVFLPINGRDARRLRAGIIGNMTYQEAADLAGGVRPRLTVPGHYDMFARNGENPALFADYMRVKYPGLHFWIGPHGTAVRLLSYSWPR